MRTSRLDTLDRPREEILNRQASHLGYRADVARRNPAPLADGGTAYAAGPCDPGGHPALVQQRGKSGFSGHVRSLSENPTICKRELIGHVGSSELTCRTIRRILRAMVKLSVDDIARRLRAIREEIGWTPAQMIDALGVGRGAYYQWEKGAAAKKPNFPAEEAMATLCELLPGLTMDYIYRGKLETMPPGLGIRLTAREIGEDPGAAGFDPAAARLAWASALAEQQV